MLFKFGSLSWKNRIRGQEAGLEKPDPIETTDLTFSVTYDYPDKVLSANEGLHRAIGTKGRTTLYSILAMNLNGNDTAIARKVKAKVISDLVDLQVCEGTQNLIRKAFELCLERLMDFKTNERKDVIAYLVAHDIIGHGPISILLEDASNIEEIEINSPDSNISVFHTLYGRCVTNLRFNSENSFRLVVNRLISAAEKELNSTFPIIDAQLADGSRVHAQLKPYSIKGAAASIRLNTGKGIDIRRLIETKTASPIALAYLWLAIEAKKNIIISGAPASGKTSLLLAINALVGRRQRIVTIEEDINELKFFPNFTNVIPLQGSSRSGDIGLRDQVINALHMRPERLIIGEIRGSEAKEAFSGANLGIPFMTTMHTSGNGLSIINRLVSAPMLVEQSTLNMLDLSLFMMQNAGGNRYLESIVEYNWHSRGEVETDACMQDWPGLKLNTIMKNGVFDEETLKASKVVKAFSEYKGETAAETLKELKRRARFLSSMILDKNHVKASYEYIAAYNEGV
ncbi:MAG: type II/IV secretion system ATPase subunit [Candidatus Micrarchaeales archaeon]|nr:type II/IV secretion system ATPase subunit [Candidatus Micrarchaeales archaeon]